MSARRAAFQRAIKRLLNSGITQKSIAAKLGVSENTLTGLANGKDNPRWRLGANLLALSEDRYPATLPQGIVDFQDLIGQLADAGWTQTAIAISISFPRTSVSTVATRPGFEPRYMLGDALIRLHARSVR